MAEEFEKMKCIFGVEMYVVSVLEKRWQLTRDGRRNCVSEKATMPASSESKSESSKECVCIEPVDWTVLKDGDDGRTIESIPFTGK